MKPIRRLARETLAILDAGTYTSAAGGAVDLSKAACRASESTRVVTPQRGLELADALSGSKPVISVTDETTQEAAHRLDGHVGALNYANAHVPGGGFLLDARAQEEDLCRCSALYPALEQARSFYSANRKNLSPIYTDHVIVSPGVPFFRTGGEGPLLDAPFDVTVVTAPAPNARMLLGLQKQEIREAFARRWRIVLGVAAEAGVDRLVLGAWGCGAFGNDPQMVVETVRPALAQLPFAEVVFAIPNRGRDGERNHAAFREVLMEG